MKVAYIANGMYNSAGMERVLAAKVNALCYDLDITFITLDSGSKPDYFPLDTRIKRVYLNAIGKDETEAKLRTFLMPRRFDITVTTGGTEFFVLHRIKDGSKKLFEFHFSYDISEVWMRRNNKGFKGWMMAKLQTSHRLYLARKYNHTVVLTKTDCKKWSRYVRNVSYIYNPLTIDTTHISSCENKKVIAVGRLDYQKGFDMLIDVWKKVNLQYPDWKLDVYGEGAERKNLERQIYKNNLSDTIVLHGRVNNVVEKYLESSIYVLSSRTEAFGLVITEAEACGLPIVSFDCPYGPSEIIEHGENGFLVPPGDTHLLANRIIELIEDVDKRKAFGKRSKVLAGRFVMEEISKQWIDLYNKMVLNKK